MHGSLAAAVFDFGASRSPRGYLRGWSREPRSAAAGSRSLTECEREHKQQEGATAATSPTVTSSTVTTTAIRTANTSEPRRVGYPREVATQRRDHGQHDGQRHEHLESRPCR